MAGGILTGDVSSELGLESVIIPNAAAISPAVDLKARRLHHLIFPAGMTSVDISFDVSPDDVTYVPLYDATGEYKILAAQVGASRAILINLPDFFGIRFLKLKTSVNMTADRTITLVAIPR
jgi:hypothetical protein